ncbi:hypothetical protein [Paludisphaera mucosa]|uniref:PDZ domain-containing protein n=1 Tax=Paludisphaera mucosa TaxID=3030827 RepID=A0ABT6FET9_9BACT|nr:hypothetical protein [Paludisphaera mucosa]MDG3005890.1 hypothetical protein [Paludisphaera mucosa]
MSILRTKCLDAAAPGPALLAVILTSIGLAGSSRGEDLFAPNLKVTYRLVPHGDALAAELTRYPEPRSPAHRIRLPAADQIASLEPGDRILALDNRPIRSEADVRSGVGAAKIRFIDGRTGEALVGTVDLPRVVWPPEPPPRLFPEGSSKWPPEKEPRLGVELSDTWYPWPFRHDDYSFEGMVVLRSPEGRSPARRVRLEDGKIVALKPGDLILSMNERANPTIENLAMIPEGDAPLSLLDVETGQLVRGSVRLDAKVPARERPGAGDGEAKDPGEAPAALARSQPELRAIVAEEVRTGGIRVRAPSFSSDGPYLLWDFGPCYTAEPLDETTKWQVWIEGFRQGTAEPMRSEWEPILGRAEGVLGREMERRNRAGPLPSTVDRDFRRAMLYVLLDGLGASMRTQGTRFPPYHVPPSGGGGGTGLLRVNLTTRTGTGTIHYMNRLHWRIITESQKREPKPGEWMTCRAGDGVSLAGWYAYFVEYPEGKKSAIRRDLHIRRDGAVTVD